MHATSHKPISFHAKSARPQRWTSTTFRQGGWVAANYGTYPKTLSPCVEAAIMRLTLARDCQRNILDKS
jgi:hypothetical protein